MTNKINPVGKFKLAGIASKVNGTTNPNGWSTGKAGGSYQNANGGDDLQNSNGLDESVSGIYDENGTNLMMRTDPWALQYGINAANFGKKRPYPKETEFMPQPMIDLGADGSSKKYGINAASFGNKRPYPKETEFMPQPMIDLGFDGIGKEKNEIIDLRLAAMPHGNPRREFDIAYGADSETQQFTPEEIAALHASSGTKKPLLDWLQSDSAQNLFNSAIKVADTIKTIKGKVSTSPSVNTGSGTIPTYNNGGNVGNVGNQNPPAKKSSTTILGMSPVVFGLVAFGTIAVLSVVSIFVIRKVKSKKINSTNTTTV